MREKKYEHKQVDESYTNFIYLFKDAIHLNDVLR